MSQRFNPSSLEALQELLERLKRTKQEIQAIQVRLEAAVQANPDSLYGIPVRWEAAWQDDLRQRAGDLCQRIVSHPAWKALCDAEDQKAEAQKRANNSLNPNCPDWYW
jgi:hypothetical protein